MADARLTDLTQLASVADGDKIYVVDISDTSEAASGSSRYTTIEDLFTGRTIPTAVMSEGLVVNEAGDDYDMRVEGASDENLIFVDAGNDRVGIGTSAPSEKIHVIGNFRIDDAVTDTKGYRFRTSGSSLDLDAAGADLVISVFDDAGFVGTQNNKIRFGDGDFTTVAGSWEWKDDNNLSGTTAHSINANGGVVFNEIGEDRDTRIEGANDENLLFVDASTDRVGIGTATPAALLDVDGVIRNSTGIVASVSPRVTSTASSATPTPNADTTDMYILTALAAAAEFGAPTGTPTQGQRLIIRVEDDGTARALTYNAIYRALGITLPTTTTLGKVTYIGLIYNSTDTKWDAVATVTEA